MCFAQCLRLTIGAVSHPADSQLALQRHADPAVFHITSCVKTNTEAIKHGHVPTSGNLLFDSYSMEASSFAVSD